MRMKLGALLAAGVLVAGCGAGPANLKQQGDLAPTSSTYSIPAYSAPVTTETPITTPEPPAPETTSQPVEPKTTAAPATCGADYYRNSDGNCVHRPSDNPAGATAQCKDGSYSYSRHRSGTCSGHGGVRTWL